MRITDKDGKPVDITMEEAERIASMVGKESEPEEDRYTKRALDNIESITGVRPKTEDELKKVLYDHTSNTSMHDIDLMYETVEAIIGWHSAKHKTM